MFLTRKNLNGGRRLNGFPIREQDGRLGYLLGYCDHCNEMVLMAMQQRDELIATFHCSDDTYKKLKKILEPKLTLYSVFIKWVAKWVNGRLQEFPMVQN